MKLHCPVCSQALGGFDDLCGHRNPVGQCCCPDEHPTGYHDDEYGDAA